MNRIIHPTNEEVKERFFKEVDEYLKTPTPQMIAIAKRAVIKKWESEGKRVDNLGENFMDLLEASLITK